MLEEKGLEAVYTRPGLLEPGWCIKQNTQAQKAGADVVVRWNFPYNRRIVAMSESVGCQCPLPGTESSESRRYSCSSPAHMPRLLGS